MIQVKFSPDKLSGKQRDWWVRWLGKAEIASQQTTIQITEGRKAEFSSRIWSLLKKWLLMHVFHGKCAYCESIVTTTDYGDADHYRPKGSVADVPHHSGYYWLAYEWKNLLPCCSRCNSGGKCDYFPVLGDRVFTPQEGITLQMLDSIERPLLLHPYGEGDCDPRKHLLFNKLGFVCERDSSERGQISIRVYKLDREELETARKASIERASLKYLARMQAHVIDNLPVIVNDICNDKCQHSAAISDALLELWGVGQITLDQQLRPSIET